MLHCLSVYIILDMLSTTRNCFGFILVDCIIFIYFGDHFPVSNFYGIFIAKVLLCNSSCFFPLATFHCLLLGKESFSAQAKLNVNPKGSQRIDDSFIGNAEACYLYALGPDAFHLYHECGDQYPTRLSRYVSVIFLIIQYIILTRVKNLRMTRYWPSEPLFHVFVRTVSVKFCFIAVW